MSGATRSSNSRWYLKSSARWRAERSTRVRRWRFSWSRTRAEADRTARLLRETGRACTEVGLPPGDITPGAGLPADSPIGADRPKPAGGVQRDARRVGHCDPGEGNPVALPAQQRQQGVVEGPPDPASAVLVSDVDRDLGGPAVGRALTVS